MRLLLLSTLFATIFSTTATAQVVGGEFQKLFDLYAVEKYEACLIKAMKYTEDDRYRKSPEPYLYVSMCFHYINENINEFDELYYEKALYDAMKYAAKFRKKDKSGEMYANNTEYIEELTKTCIDEANYFYFDDNFRKAAGVFRKIHKFLPEDAGLLYMVAVCQIRSRNLGEGVRNMNLALDSLRVKYANPAYEPMELTEKLLVRAFIDYSTYLEESGQKDSAESTISTARELLKKDEAVKEQYDKLVN